ncbi:MAG: aminotransferase class I/II-fold pyridoxal phosphate-dependent enzyme, partial [Clostridiales bacterium]|nr:aminotransferase class I/II-fold pyridoxal phosphate-dependent enzyme [Clostridiales bacterium]
GNIWTREEIAKIGSLCKKHGVTVISDEIHCNFTMHGHKYIPFASVSEECRDNSITCVSASKTFNIAGLQSAAVIIPNKSLRERVVRGLNSDEVAEPNCFAIDSVIAAFNEGEEWLDGLMAYITENRKFVCEYLSKNLPKARPVPSNSTYVAWIDCSAFTADTDELCAFLKKETGLILSAGSIFRGNGKTFVRLNTACNRNRLEDGLNRFVKGVKEYVKWKK